MRAALLDVDGTLTDSNYQHITAWGTAFDECGHHVAQWRIHRAIGMAGDQLMPALMGRALADKIGARASERHDEIFAELAGSLHAYDGAADLVAQMMHSGLLVVLASSAKPAELQILLDVLKLTVEPTAITSSEDVVVSKPAPDLMDVALERAGVSAEDAFMVGDATWDMEAAVRSGVTGVGLLAGGISATELQDAGAGFVFADPKDLGTHLAAFL